VADPRETGGATANQLIFDAALRHQVGLRRFTAGEVARIVKLLEEADRDLVKQLRERLGSVRGRPTDYTSERLQRILEDVRVARREAFALMRGQLSPTLRKLARMEADFEGALLRESIPFTIELATVQPEQLRAIVTTQPFAGANLGQWYSSLATSDQGNLTRAIQLGLSQGENLDQIVRRVAGTRSAGFRDGVLALNRRNAETVVRTAINGVSNAAREAVWTQNADIISALRWTSVLDGRTSPVCRGRDGALAPVTPGGPLPDGAVPLDPPGARPPAHPGCRSVMVAQVDGVAAVGTRPTVTDTRTRERREVDFRREAKKSGLPIQEVRKRWADRNIGFTPASTNYNSWLRTQPPAFQADVLGPARARLFREGGLSLDQFVDATGRQYTLAELARDNARAFARAGL
jgi:SPP1 gp7 family putative phage head morphogenesis protein